jgi:hypothetical protein
MAALQVLIGLVINKIEEVHDYIQIVFTDGTVLSIFNNYVYDAGSVVELEGKEVKFAEEPCDTILIVFDDDSFVCVGLNDDDYNGPEAMVLKQEGKPPIIWD